VPQNDEHKATVHRCLLGTGDARAIAVEATQLVKLLQDVHNLSFLATAALGRLVMASMMMVADQKVKRARITLKVEGDGPLGEVVADAENRGKVRGYVKNPWVELPLSEKGKWNVSAGVGSNGYLTVIKDLGLKRPLISKVPLVSGEIAEDIACYYAKSEQIPTAIALGVLQKPSLGVLSAGGLMVQLLPDADESFVGMLERLLEKYDSISRLAEQVGSSQDILETIFKDLSKKWQGSTSFEFGCRCSRNLVKALLLSMPELESERDVLEVRCHFCNKVYTFTPEEIEELKGGGRS
jgi:molecular chaperone Hsp33